MAEAGTQEALSRGQPSAVKVLTIRQPWAWATIYGGKDVENRRWRTAYRGVLLIHAGQDADPEPGASTRLLWTMADPEAFGRPRAAWQARGAIIGVVVLADVLTDSSSRWAAARWYHWVFEFPSPVDPPIPCRGRPGLWVPSAAVADKVTGAM
jgi:ASCH domain